MPAEAGDVCTFWRRDPGGKSEIVQCEVLETIEETDWALIRRFDTNGVRPVSLKRLRVVKLREDRTDWDPDKIYEEITGESSTTPDETPS